MNNGLPNSGARFLAGLFCPGLSPGRNRGLVVVVSVAVGVDLVVGRLGSVGMDLGILVVAVLVGGITVLVVVDDVLIVVTAIVRLGCDRWGGRCLEHGQPVRVAVRLAAPGGDPAFEVAGDDAVPPGAVLVTADQLNGLARQDRGQHRVDGARPMPAVGV